MENKLEGFVIETNVQTAKQGRKGCYYLWSFLAFQPCCWGWQLFILCDVEDLFSICPSSLHGGIQRKPSTSRECLCLRWLPLYLILQISFPSASSIAVILLCKKYVHNIWSRAQKPGGSIPGMCPDHQHKDSFSLALMQTVTSAWLVWQTWTLRRKLGR